MWVSFFVEEEILVFGWEYGRISMEVFVIDVVFCEVGGGWSIKFL